jgi:hypothetical protein
MPPPPPPIVVDSVAQIRSFLVSARSALAASVDADSQPTIPTRSLSSKLASHLLPRQAETTLISIQSKYGALGSSPEPGVVVGIVLAAVAGFLLLLWAVYSCLGVAPAASEYTSTYGGTASVLTLRSRHHHHHKSSSPRMRAAIVTEEVRTTTRASGGRSSGPVIVDAEPPPREHIEIREERRHSRAPSARIVHEDSDDEVVVIEEDSPPRRQRRRSSTHYSSDNYRRESGYRDVDPDRYAGGDSPMRSVRRESRRRSGDR